MDIAYRPHRLQAARRRAFGDVGVMGSAFRMAVLLVFAAYFLLPLLWLLVAPSKDPTLLY